MVLLSAELRSCVKVEVVVLGYPSLTVHVVSRCKATLNLKYFLFPELKIKDTFM